MTLESRDHVRIRNLAYLLWQERGSPLNGTSQEDWFRAEEMLEKGLSKNILL
jgi:hypothetical protein